MTRIRFSGAASEDVKAAGKEFNTASQQEVDDVETATRGIVGNLEGPDADAAHRVGKTAYERGIEMQETGQQAEKTDERAHDTNLTAMSRMRSLFSNQD